MNCLYFSSHFCSCVCWVNCIVMLKESIMCWQHKETRWQWNRTTIVSSAGYNLNHVHIFLPQWVWEISLVSVWSVFVDLLWQSIWGLLLKPDQSKFCLLCWDLFFIFIFRPFRIPAWRIHIAFFWSKCCFCFEGFFFFFWGIFFFSALFLFINQDPDIVHSAS